jgi:hypothetical protein
MYAAPPPPPVEWVRSESRWWLARFVFPALLGSLVLSAYFVVFYVNPSWSVFGPVVMLPIVVGCLTSQYTIMHRLPSVRRIGISPTGIVVDVGLVKQSYSWAELRDVTRTHVNELRGSQLVRVDRTRLSVGHGLMRQGYGLSPRQGERLAQFLRIP